MDDVLQLVDIYVIGSVTKSTINNSSQRKTDKRDVALDGFQNYAGIKKGTQVTMETRVTTLSNLGPRLFVCLRPSRNLKPVYLYYCPYFAMSHATRYIF